MRVFSDKWQEIGFGITSNSYMYGRLYWNVYSQSPLQSDTWYFATLVWDKENTIAALYLNDVFQNEIIVDLTGKNGFNDPPFCVGLDYQSGNLANPFEGIVDELRIYNRSLTADEIRALYRFYIGI